MPEGIGYGPRSNALAALGQGGSGRDPETERQLTRREPDWRPQKKEKVPEWWTVDSVLKTLHEMMDPYFTERQRGAPGYSDILDEPLLRRREKAPSPFPLSPEELRARIEGDSGPSITQDPSGRLVPTGPTGREVVGFIKDVALPTSAFEAMFEGGPVGQAMVPIAKATIAKKLKVMPDRPPLSKEGVSKVPSYPSEADIKKAIEEAKGAAPPGSQEYLALRKLQSKASSSDATLKHFEAGTGTRKEMVKKGKQKPYMRTMSPEDKAFERLDAERAQRALVYRDLLDPEDLEYYRKRRQERLEELFWEGHPVSPEFGRQNFPLQRAVYTDKHPPFTRELPSTIHEEKLKHEAMKLNAEQRAAESQVDLPGYTMDVSDYEKKNLAEHKAYLTEMKKTTQSKVAPELQGSYTGAHHIGTRLPVRDSLQRYGPPHGRDYSIGGDGSPLTRFGKGGQGDVALPHGAMGDGISLSFGRARQEFEAGKRRSPFPTKEETESWMDFVFADQGKNLPDDARRVFLYHDPEYLMDVTLRAIRDGDVTRIASRWYNDFHKEVSAIVGPENMEEFSALFSLLSPQNPVEANLRDALNSMRLAREYDDLIKAAGRSEWDQEEFVKFYRDVLRGTEESREIVKAGGEVLVPAPGGKEVQQRLHLKATADETGAITGTTLEGPITTDAQAEKIYKFYKQGRFEGSLKTKSFFLTVLEKDRMGAAATATNDVRVGAFFGNAEMFEEGYQAAQHLAAEVSREMSSVLKRPVTTDEVQAIWWLLGESPKGKELVGGKLGKTWPYQAGSLESALAYSKPEIDLYLKSYSPTGTRFASGVDPKSPEIGITMQQGLGEFPITRQMFEFFTRAQKKEIEDLAGGATQSPVKALGKKAIEAGGSVLDALREEVWGRTKLIKE